MKFAFFILLVFANRIYGQDKFNFYGNTVQLPDVSPQEYNKLVNDIVIPASLVQYVDKNIELYNLQDWSTVLFLKQYVYAGFPGITDAKKVKIFSALLTKLNINNAIGVKNKNDLTILVSISRQLHTSGIYFLDENGSKLITLDFNDRLKKIRDIQFGCFVGKDISFNTHPADLKTLEYSIKNIPFFNNITHAPDSIIFNYSPTYIQYSYDFPMVLTNSYSDNLPVSPAFISTLFKSLNMKLIACKSRTDSINFLLKFVQTAVKNELNDKTYGKIGFSSYPENTLAIGKGDCDDKCVLLTFLLNYYFKCQDILFLLYPGHVRLGIYDPRLSINSKSFLTYSRKKYFIVDTTNDFSELGDDFYEGIPYPPATSK
jgi:hypothetical protein